MPPYARLSVPEVWHLPKGCEVPRRYGCGIQDEEHRAEPAIEGHDDDQALSALAADGKLIKRPLVLGDGFALIGFREDEWRKALGV